MAVLFITHDMAVVAQMADRVVVMYQGNLIEEGTVNEIFSAPKEEYTKALLAAVPQLGQMAGTSLPSPLNIPGATVTVKPPRDDIGIEKKTLSTVKGIWAQLPNTYFSKYQIEQLQNQALIVANANFQTTASVIKRKNLLEIFIFTPNQEGLFFKTAKALESLSLETIDANIHTTNDGVFALNTFICKHKVLGSNLTKRDELGIQQKIISKLTSETKPKEKQSIAKLKKVFEHTTRVEITALLNPSSNLVTLETLDQPALLSQVAYIFYENGINVISSRITTLGEKVEDNFLVVDAKQNMQISKSKEEKVITKLKNL